MSNKHFQVTIQEIIAVEAPDEERAALAALTVQEFRPQRDIALAGGHAASIGATTDVVVVRVVEGQEPQP